MICYSLLVVCALQGATWARTVGLEGAGEVGTGTAHDKALVLGVNKYKGSLVPGGSVEKGGSGKAKSIAELLIEGVREVLRANSTGDIDAGVEQKSLTSTAKEFATELQEWIKDGEEGRHFKRHKMMARMALWLKTLLLGVVLPGAVAVALFAAWKGITLSLMALLLAGIIGIKGLVASASKGATVSPQHVVVSGLPSHHHHQWRRDHPLESPGWSDAAHHLAYRAHTP